MMNVIGHRPKEESELAGRFRTTWERMAYDIILNQEYSVGIISQDKQRHIDFVHIPTKTAIELQRYDCHCQSGAQFTEDQQRQRELLALGWTVIPFSESEILQDTRKCVEEAYTFIKRKEQAGRYQLYEDPEDYEWIDLDENPF